jgi:hypothetical protein
VRFARTSWRFRRHYHPTRIIGYVLGGASLAVILLTFSGTMGYTAGFVTLAVIILAKVGLTIKMNALLK